MKFWIVQKFILNPTLYEKEYDLDSYIQFVQAIQLCSDDTGCQNAQ